MEQDLRNLLSKSLADPELTLQLLERVNRGDFQADKVIPREFPGPDGVQILEMGGALPALEKTLVQESFSIFFPELNPKDYGTESGSEWIPHKEGLWELGLRLLGCTAYGVLNGGSATSYSDAKKNKAYGEPLFRLYEKDLETHSLDYESKPKGITPAFIHPDGTPGPSFMELKIRAVLIQNLFLRWKTGNPQNTLFFQMTSHSTHSAIISALESHRNSPVLEPLLKELGRCDLEVYTAEQGLIGTFTPKDSQGVRQVFTYLKDGKKEVLSLPGGHGQNFRVLRSIYQELYNRGVRFIYLGNVDNLGYLPDPLSLALLALSGANAGFDFSFKTPVDVKGGVLYRGLDGKLNCGDIGVALEPHRIREAEQNSDLQLLFNCATGLFNLEYLLVHLDRIIDRLPLRLSEQDKDLGKYAQVEQVTWEVLGLIDKPLIFAVEKKKRFLAAKILLESFMTSGYRLEDYPKDDSEGLLNLAKSMNQGLTKLLQGPYGFQLSGNRWEPLSLEALKAKFDSEGLLGLSL